jgi:hypothetical protein
VRRTKLRRKDLRGPDEFVTFTNRAWTWVRENSTLAAVIGGAAVLLLVLLLGMQRYARSRDHAAAEAFRKALALLSAGDTPAAAEAFAAMDTVAPYGALAELYRGHTALRNDDPATAGASFRAFAGRRDMPAALRQLALYDLAFALAEEGDQKAALQEYEEASTLSGPYTTDAQLAAARLHETLGAPDKARPLYEAVASNPEHEDLRSVARLRLNALDAAAARPTPATAQRTP